MTLGEKINQANAEALKRILGAQPTLVGMGTAGEDIPGMTKKTILHAGPPVTWDKMVRPVAALSSAASSTRASPPTRRRPKSWPPRARSPLTPATTTTRSARWPVS